MRKLIIASIMLVLSIGYAEAKSHHHKHPFRHTAGASHRTGHISSSHRRSGLYVCAGCVVRDTLAGVVAISRQNAEKIVATINDLWKAGFRGPVHCAAPYGTHVSHSRHYSGNACDMAQTGWGKTPAKVMYTKVADSIIRKHGLRNGCSFRDCGHFDDGMMLASYHRRHYAHRVHYAHAG